MAEFADRHATKREAVSFSKAFEGLDSFDYFAGGLGIVSHGG